MATVTTRAVPDLTVPVALDPTTQQKQVLINLGMVPNNKMFGAKCDAKPMNDCSTYGAAVVYSSSFTGARSEFGKKVFIPGGNSDGSVFVGTITSSKTNTAYLDAAPIATSHTYSYFGTDDTIANQACIDYVAAQGGGFVPFAPGSSISNGLLIRNGCTLLGQSARSGKTLLVGTGRSRWVVSSDTTSGAWNGGISGLDLTGIGNGFGLTATGSGPVQGGFEIGGLGIYEDIGVSSFGEQNIGCRPDAIAYTLRSVFSSRPNRNHQTAETSNVERGGIELAGTDGVLQFVESYGGQTALLTTSLRNAGFYLKPGGGNHDLVACRAEQADCGFIDLSQLTRFTNCRAMLNFGHGFSGLLGRHVNGEALGNSKGAPGTYNGYDTRGFGGGFLTNCRSEKAIYSDGHKFGFGGAVPNGGRVSILNCTSEGHTYQAVNPAAFLQRDAPVASAGFDFLLDYTNGRFTSGGLTAGTPAIVPGYVAGPNVATIPFAPPGDFVVWCEVVAPSSGFRNPIGVADATGHGFLFEFGIYGVSGSYGLGTGFTAPGVITGMPPLAAIARDSTVKIAMGITNGKAYMAVNGVLSSAFDASPGVAFTTLYLGQKYDLSRTLGYLPTKVGAAHGTYTSAQILALTV